MGCLELLTYAFSSISNERRQTSTLNLKNSSNKNVFTKGRRRPQNESFSKNHNFAVLFKTAPSKCTSEVLSAIKACSLEKMQKISYLFIFILDFKVHQQNFFRSNNSPRQTLHQANAKSLIYNLYFNIFNKINLCLPITKVNYVYLFTRLNTAHVWSGI